MEVTLPYKKPTLITMLTLRTLLRLLTQWQIYLHILLNGQIYDKWNIWLYGLWSKKGGHWAEIDWSR